MASGDHRNQREVPLGRRVAQWRMQRRMTQQMLADRLGKSKSWVDKVERGIRALDRVSVLHDLAEVLEIAPAALLDPRARPTVRVPAVEGVEGLRAALAAPGLVEYRQTVGSVEECARQLDHAWLTYQHARYPQLLRLLPGLLGAARHAQLADQDRARAVLVQAYRLTAQVLIKLGEPELAWLAADRAVGTAGDNPLLAAAGTIPLGQALRALDRPHLAQAVTLTAARHLSPAPPRAQEARSLHGTLLVEAALSAAVCPDRAGAAELLRQAAEAAAGVPDGQDQGWTGFGPTAVALARATALALLGETGDALDRYERVNRREGWRLLPVEHRAGYLLDVARGCLRSGDLLAAGRLLVAAERAAPAEVRTRPCARALVTDILRGGGGPPVLVRLAGELGTG